MRAESRLLRGSIPARMQCRRRPRLRLTSLGRTLKCGSRGRSGRLQVRIIESGGRLTWLRSRSDVDRVVTARRIRLRNGSPRSILREMFVCPPAPVHALDPLSFGYRRPACAEF